MTTLREVAEAIMEQLKGGWVCESDPVAQDLKAALAEPVQEPVAWMLTDAQNTRLRFLEWQKETRPYSGEWIKTPLYTSPPQRKPLTEEEVFSIFRTSGSPVAFARAIERAHGIK